MSAVSLVSPTHPPEFDSETFPTDQDRRVQTVALPLVKTSSSCSQENILEDWCVVGELENHDEDTTCSSSHTPDHQSQDLSFNDTGKLPRNPGRLDLMNPLEQWENPVHTLLPDEEKTIRQRGQSVVSSYSSEPSSPRTSSTHVFLSQSEDRAPVSCQKAFFIWLGCCGASKNDD